MGRFKTNQERERKRMLKKMASTNNDQEIVAKQLKGFRPKHLKSRQLKSIKPQDPSIVKLGQFSLRQKIG